MKSKMRKMDMSAWLKVTPQAVNSSTLPAGPVETKSKPKSKPKPKVRPKPKPKPKKDPPKPAAAEVEPVGYQEDDDPGFGEIDPNDEAHWEEMEEPCLEAGPMADYGSDGESSKDEDVQSEGAEAVPQRRPAAKTFNGPELEESEEEDWA